MAKVHEERELFQLELRDLGMPMSIEHGLVIHSDHEFSEIYLDIMFRMSGNLMMEVGGTGCRYVFDRTLSLRKKEDVAELKRAIKMLRELEDIELVING